MRLTHRFEGGDFGPAQAAAAAGVTENRLNVWLTRGAFRSREDLDGSRAPRDPRRFTNSDVLRMRLLGVLSDAGVGIADAGRVVSLFTGERPELEPAFIVLAQTPGGFEVHSAGSLADAERLVFPSAAGRPGNAKLRCVLDIEAVRDAVLWRLAEVATGTAKPALAVVDCDSQKEKNA